MALHLSIRAVLKAGDVALATRVFLAMMSVETDGTQQLDTILKDPPNLTLAGIDILYSVHVKQHELVPFTNVPVFRLAAFVEEVRNNLNDDDGLKPRAEMLSKEWFSPTVRAIARREAFRIAPYARQEILYALALEMDDNPGTGKGMYTESANAYRLGAEPVDETWTQFALHFVGHDEYVEAMYDANFERRRGVSARRSVSDVGPRSIWELRSRDGAMNRDVWEVYNPHFGEYLETTMSTDCSQHWVTTRLACDDEEFAHARRWRIVVLTDRPRSFDNAVEAFIRGKYTEAEACFEEPATCADGIVRHGIFRLANRLRRGDDRIDEIEFELLEAAD